MTTRQHPNAMPIVPLCGRVHTWGSFRPMPTTQDDGTVKMIRACPYCLMTMEAFAKKTTPNRQRTR